MMLNCVKLDETPVKTNFFIYTFEHSMKLKTKIVFSLTSLLLWSVVFVSGSVFGQKIDTTRLSTKLKSKFASKLRQIKANITPYKPNTLGFSTISSVSPNSILPKNPSKVLTVLKIYPNPVSDQLNINLRLDKESSLSIKITDLLGNDVVTLTNEKSPAGEQTKTYLIPNKLSTGIYFLRIIAGGEPVVKRISVL